MWTLLLLAACGPEESPDEVGGMPSFGFEHLHDDDTGSLESLGEKLEPWVADHFEEASEGYSIQALGVQELTAWGLDVAEETEVIGAMVVIAYEADLDDVALGFVWPDQASIFSGILSQDRTEIGDRDCFVAGDCESHETSDRIELDLGILDMVITYDAQMHWRHVEHDSGRAVVSGWASPGDITANVDYLDVHQQYGFGWLYPSGSGGTHAVQAIWMEAEVVGMSGGEEMALQTAIDGMIRSAEELDVWVESRR